MKTMTLGPRGPRLPLVVLADAVHFPRTEIRLHVAGPTSARLVHDVIEKDEDARFVGLVLLKPGAGVDAAGRPEVFPGGTASRVMDAEVLPDGVSELVLHGEFRFWLRREVADQGYRQAVVEPVEEPWLNERDAGIVAVRGSILELLRALAADIGDRFPFDGEGVDALARRCGFEELVNRVAAEIDLPPMRKQLLLQQALPERGLSVLSVLRGRRAVMDQLRPFRHLATSERNN